MSNYHIKQFLQKYEFTYFDEYKPMNHIFGKEKMFAHIGINAS